MQTESPATEAPQGPPKPSEVIKQVTIPQVHFGIMNYPLGVARLIQPIEAVVENVYAALYGLGRAPEPSPGLIEATVKDLFAQSGERRNAAKALAKTLNVWEPEDTADLYRTLAGWVNAALAVRSADAPKVDKKPSGLLDAAGRAIGS